MFAVAQSWATEYAARRGASAEGKCSALLRIEFTEKEAFTALRHGVRIFSFDRGRYKIVVECGAARRDRSW